MDLTRFLAHSMKVQIDDLDWQLAGRVGLSDDEAALLAHIGDIEGQTPYYMRELMNTPARFQADTVGFLTIWNYEEYFHSDAIHQLLRACGRTAVDVSSVRRKATFRARFEEVGQGLLARVAPEAFTALYFSWGATQEFLTTQVYRALAERTANPVLKTLATRIARQERRHFAWYYAGAREHLERSRFGRRLTRLIIDRAWTPVGVGVKSDEQNVWVMKTLFAGNHRPLFERLHEKISALPGLGSIRGLMAYCDRVSGQLERGADDGADDGAVAAAA